MKCNQKKHGREKPTGGNWSVKREVRDCVLSFSAKKRATALNSMPQIRKGRSKKGREKNQRVRKSSETREQKVRRKNPREGGGERMTGRSENLGKRGWAKMMTVNCWARGTADETTTGHQKKEQAYWCLMKKNEKP